MHEIFISPQIYISFFHASMIKEPRFQQIIIDNFPASEMTILLINLQINRKVLIIQA